MKAHEKRKFYRQACARKLRAGLAPNSQGEWGKHGSVPDSIKHHLQHCAHPYAKRKGD